MASRPRLTLPSLPSFLTGLVVLVAALFTFLELRPDLLFANTTAAGGDMGSHVWLPQYLRDHLLPHGRITGWANDWYNGFPALQFYFPVPSVMVVILDLVMPYNVAFKLVTVSGLVALPVCAWAFGRLARLPFPAPACLAAATLPFLFDTGYTIFGGNIASTLAGEFAFSIGLAFSFLFLGVVAGGLHTNRRRALAATLFGLVVMSHVLPTIFAVTGGMIFFFMRLVTGRQEAERSEVVDGMNDPYASPDDRRDPSRRDRRRSLIRDRRRGDVVLDADGKPVITEDEERQTVESGWKDRLSAFKWGFPVVLFGGLLSSAWLIPFVLRMDFMNDMGWEKIQPNLSNGEPVASAVELYDQKIFTYTDALFPTEMYSVLALAVVGAGLSLYLRRRVGIFFIILAALSALAFVYMPQGRLWNARFLPFWYLTLYMLSGLAIAELGWGIADAIRALRHKAGVYYRDVAEGVSLVTPIIAITLALFVVMSSLPAPSWWKFNSALWFDSSSTKADGTAETSSFIPGWTSWNYSGYERKDAYPEFSNLVNTMGTIGQKQGCGRAMWEYESELNRFGTPMALMLMPKFTNGCIGSEEGLFFESSPTVPYHFLNQSEMSAVPSRAMRGLPYPSMNISSGVDKLQLWGVKYYMAVTPTAQQEAALEPRLTLLASIPAAAATDGTARTWNVYEVADSEIVKSVTNLPAVMTDQASKSAVTSDSKTETGEESVSGTAKPRNARELWLDNGVSWYQNPTDYNVFLAASGPKNWPRVINADDPAPEVPVDPVNVSYVAVGDDRISFNVDRIGVPVVVKMSYFPNWQVSGADGVYRVTPNMMVVVPTSKHVELHYGHTPVDWLGIVMSIAGIVGIIWLALRERSVRAISKTVAAGRNRRPRTSRLPEPEPDPSITTSPRHSADH